MTYRTAVYRPHAPYGRAQGIAGVTKVIANAVSQSEFRMRAAQVLIATCAITGIFYAINLYSIISSTVALQHIGTESRALTSQIETLDGQYLKLSSTITPDTLATYGLQKGEVSFFISRSASLGRVAFGGHEL
ncbi:MAG: hypothetical protein V4481_03765 [Patescibacteria group bacterium]